MCKLSSQIDLLKTTVSKRHSNYCGLKKNMFFTRPPKSVAILCFVRAFWCHLADFGCHFGPSWIPRGVQKSCFWVSCWKNDEKRVSENETRKTSKINRKFVPKWEGLGGENECFAGAVLQNKGFRGIVKYWKVWCQKGSKKRPKSEPKRSQIRFLRFLAVLGGAEI